MRVVFFDTATHAGWAFSAGGDDRRFGTIVLQRTGDEVAPFLAQAARLYGELIDEVKPDLVGFESVELRSGRDNPTKLRKLYGLANAVEMAAWKRHIECREERASVIRGYFLGKGYPRKSALAKAAVMRRCESLGWDLEDADQADAAAGLDYLLSLQRGPEQTSLELRRRRDVA